MGNLEWNIKNAPSQEGKVAVVTGANSGLGFETAKALAMKGALVVMACRNMEKAEKAKSKIRSSYSDAKLITMEIDLASLKSVRKFASEYNLEHNRLDILVNNAGVMMPPYRKTEDGFELQLGANYLGHFLLTALLLRKLEAAESARVVSLASIAHRWGDIYFDDLNFEKKYDKQKSYGQSKLACLMFAYELERQLRDRGSSIRSFAAHPGLADTALAKHLPKMVRWLMPVVAPLIAQSAGKGALPSLRAALDQNLKGGEYLGPDGFNEMKGNPVVVDSSNTSKNLEKAKRLWDVSEKMTGADFFQD